jgi:hypothetical protein
MEWVVVGLAVLAILVAVVAWRWPRSPKALRPEPPSLRLEQTGGIADQQGSPSEYLTTKLRVVNAVDGGTARNWQVSIATPSAITGFKLAKYPLRGPGQFADPLQWQQDAVLREIPAGQSREFVESFHVEGPTGAEIALLVTIRAEGAEAQNGRLVVKLPSAPGGRAVHYET